MRSFNFSQITTSLDEWHRLDTGVEYEAPEAGILVVAHDSPIESLTTPVNRFGRIVVISVDFNDGRIFSIGRQIRLLGCRARLTIVGDILQDQHTALKSCGFDDVLVLENPEIPEIIDLDQALPLPGVEEPVRTVDSNFSTGSRQ